MDREEDGQRQVHLLPRAGGEARQLSHLEGEIQSGRSLDPLAWFPDGSRIAVIMAEPKDADARAREERGDDRIVFEEEPRFWRLWSVDARSGEAVAISPAGLQVWEFALSPDGRRVAAVVSDQPYEWDWYAARLAVFDIGGSEARTIHQSWRQVAKPAWSPDGATIAFLTSNWSDRGIDIGQAMVVPIAGGEAQPVGADDGVSDASVAFRSNRELITATNVHGGSGVSRIDLAGGTRTWLWTAQALAPTISRAIRRDGVELFATVLEDVDHPPEVHVGDLRDGRLAWRRLTNIHADQGDVVRGETREVRWTAPDGVDMQGLLLLPPGAGTGPIPLVTLVHGGPTGAIRFEYQPGRWSRVLADAGLAVFLPNYRGSTGWGLQFAEANIGDMGGADYADIMSGIDQLVADHIADPDRLGIAGWSYGGS